MLATDDDIYSELSHRTQEGFFASVVAISVSFFVCSVAYTMQCTAQFTCINDGTCRALYDNSCSYANIVSPIGFSILNTSGDIDALHVFSRGVCAPGEHQSTNMHGMLNCVRAPSFPNAFVNEIADPGGLTDHERACGKWIHARSISPRSTEYFSFYDAPKVAVEVTESIKYDIEIENDYSDIARFMSACKTMLINSAVAPSSSLAYEYLSGFVDLHDTSRVGAALQTLGMLTAHYCDVPVALGLAYDSTKGMYTMKLKDGRLLSSDEAHETLYSVGESFHVRNSASEFISAMERASTLPLVELTDEHVSDLITGALQSTRTSSVNSVFNVDGLKMNTHADDLWLLSRFIHAYEATSTEHARAYLLACASNCALSVRSVITGEFGANVVTERAAVSFRLQHKKATALGRLALEGDQLNQFAHVNESVIFETSTISWSMLTGSHSRLYKTTPTQASSTCWDAAMIVFADAMDARVYNKMVSNRVVSNVLSPLIEDLKRNVAHELQSGRMSTLIKEEHRNILSSNALATQFRISGAPRTSSFGRKHTFKRPTLTSNDGALLIMLKQASALFMDRVGLALHQSDICEHPPLYSSTDRNAYMLTAAPCAMLLPGILVPPFVSDRYDEKSIYGRIGFVIAHEIAHVTSDQRLWNTTVAEGLLLDYSASTWNEAVADLTAVGSILTNEKLTTEEACSHVSQLWCARVHASYGTGAESTHPPANARGDRMCTFLRRMQDSLENTSWLLD